MYCVTSHIAIYRQFNLYARSPASMERLKALEDKTEAGTYAEVMKHTFKLYERMIEHAESGDVFLVRYKKGNKRKLEF